MEPTLWAWLKKTVDLTLAELSARLAERGIAIKVPALWHQLNKWKLTLKKTLYVSEQERSYVHAARYEWQASQAAMDITKLVLLDETGASTKWRDVTVMRHAANVASPPYHMDTGTPPPLSRGCGMMTSPHSWWQTLL